MWIFFISFLRLTSTRIPLSYRKIKMERRNNARPCRPRNMHEIFILDLLANFPQFHARRDEAHARIICLFIRRNFVNYAIIPPAKFLHSSPLFVRENREMQDFFWFIELRTLIARNTHCLETFKEFFIGGRGVGFWDPGPKWLDSASEIAFKAFCEPRIGCVFHGIACKCAFYHLIFNQAVLLFGVFVLVCLLQELNIEPVHLRRINFWFKFVDHSQLFIRNRTYKCIKRRESCKLGVTFCVDQLFNISWICHCIKDILVSWHLWSPSNWTYRFRSHYSLIWCGQ